VSSKLPLAANTSRLGFDGTEVDKSNNGRATRGRSSKMKKYRDTEPHTPLKNDGLYADVYQGMYDNFKVDAESQHADM